MTIFRVSIDSLRRQAREENTYFYRTPRGTNYDRLINNGSLGNFSLVSNKPLTLRYGSTTYTITRDYVEIDVSEADYAGIEMRDIWLSARIGATLGMLGMLNVKQILHIVRRHKWIGGVLTSVDRHIMDTDAFGRAFEIMSHDYPYVRRIVVFVFRNPRLTSVAVTSAMAEILGIAKSDMADNLRKARSDGYIEEIEYEYYAESAWPVVATAEALRQDGKLSLTELRTVLSAHMSFGRAVGATNAARYSGWIERRRVGKLMRVFVTDAGREAAAKVPKPKTRHGLIATAAGRELVFKRKEA